MDNWTNEQRYLQRNKQMNLYGQSGTNTKAKLSGDLSVLLFFDKGGGKGTEK